MRLEARPARRRFLDLAPLVDVVFLLLVFFMLATRFDRERTLPLDVAGAAATADAAPERVVDVRLGADGRLAIDGQPGDLETLGRMLSASPGRRVAVRPDAEVSLARIHAVLEVVAGSEAESAALVRGF